MNELIIIYYLLGALVASGLITVWNFSYISVHLLSWIYKDHEIDSVEDLADAIGEKHPTLSELLFCPICLGFWVSLSIATIITLLNNFSYWFIPSAGFSWPVFILFFYKYFSKD
jgi:hypothetical protein